MDSLGCELDPFTPTDGLIVTRETGLARILDSEEFNGRWICSLIGAFRWESLVEANEEAGRVIFRELRSAIELDVEIGAGDLDGAWSVG